MKIKIIFLPIAFILLLFLILNLFYQRIDSRKDFSSAAFFRLMGASAESLTGILVKSVPVDNLDEKEYGEALKERFNAGKNNISYNRINKIMKILSVKKKKNFDYEVFVLEDLSSNAYAMPGGVIVVTRGLCNIMTDDELAAILGHEMGHIELSHAFDKVRIEIAAKKLNIETLGEMTNIGTNIIINNIYSMAQENEADEYAWSILNETNLRTKALSDALIKLKDENENYAKRKENMDYFTSHPPIEKRIEKFTERERIMKKNP